MFQATIEANSQENTSRDVGSIQSILRLVEIRQRRDIEDKESEEELYYESEKSV